jgi:hypothetical protein
VKVLKKIESREEGSKKAEISWMFLHLNKEKEDKD